MLTDQPRFLLEHLRRDGLAHQEGAGQVDVQRGLPGVAGDIEEGRAQPNRSVVDEDVEPAEAGDHLLDHLLRRTGLSDIHRQRQGRRDLRGLRDLEGLRGRDLNGGFLGRLAG